MTGAKRRTQRSLWLEWLQHLDGAWDALLNPPVGGVAGSRYRFLIASEARVVNPNKSRWTWWLVKLSRRIWFRALFFALMSVVGALLAVALGPLIPQGFAAQFGADAVANILEILASSLLIVATFSLSTAISMRTFSESAIFTVVPR